MKFIYFFIALIAVLIILKFIYDSYLSTNTVERWQEFKKSDPKTASKIEYSNIGAKNIGKGDALNLLKNRIKLKKGVNRNIPIFCIQLLERNQNSDYLITLDALDESTYQKALNFFKEGNYYSAIKQRANIVVGKDIAKNYLESLSMDVEVLCLNDKNQIKPLLSKTSFIQNDLRKIKDDLVIEEIKSQIISYHIESLKQIEKEHGEIKGNITATLEATDIINLNTEIMKREFLSQKDQLELSQKDIVTIIEDVTRDLIKNKIGVDLG
jgi:hypothetical protein